MFRLAFVLVIAVMAAEMSEAQAGPATATPATDPAVTQMCKVVTFITLVCNNGTQKFIGQRSS